MDGFDSDLTMNTQSSSFACLNYHIIGEGSGRFVTTSANFQLQLQWLIDNGYSTEGFEQLERRLQQPSQRFGKFVALTLDDGDESALASADLLSRFQLQATFFVTWDRSLNRAGFLRPPALRELRQRGFSLGAHGATHSKLTFMTQQACRGELRTSKQWLEDVLGEEVRYMAAPGGFINARVARIAAEEGYVLMGTCRAAMNLLAEMNMPCLVNRVNILRRHGPQTLQRIVTGDRPYYFWRKTRAAALAIPKRLLPGL